MFNFIYILFLLVLVWLGISIFAGHLLLPPWEPTKQVIKYTAGCSLIFFSVFGILTILERV